MGNPDLARQSFEGRQSRRAFLAQTARLAGLAFLLGKASPASPLPDRGCGDANGTGLRDDEAFTRAAVLHVDVTPSHIANSFDPDRSLGSSMDELSPAIVNKIYTPEIIRECLSAGWGPITYRNHTELAIEAWHWNPDGTWSDEEKRQGYFTGSSEPSGFLRHSFGYPLPRRGTRAMEELRQVTRG